LAPNETTVRGFVIEDAIELVDDRKPIHSGHWTPLSCVLFAMAMLTKTDAPRDKGRPDFYTSAISSAFIAVQLFPILDVSKHAAQSLEPAGISPSQGNDNEHPEQRKTRTYHWRLTWYWFGLGAQVSRPGLERRSD
jgi:hypothetical protein